MTLWAGSTAELEAAGWAAPVRELLDRAFGDRFSELDWEHGLGGLHVVVHRAGVVLSHGSVVPRPLLLGDRPVRCGYVEAVGTEPRLQGQGHGSTVMRALAEQITTRYELGGLCTGSPGFYTRLGWLTWLGPTWADGGQRGRVRTADEDGNVLVLPTPAIPRPQLSADLVCDWRSGDLW